MISGIIQEDPMAEMETKKSAPLLHYAAVGILVMILSACATETPLAARGPEQVYPTPQEAADVLVEASRRDDKGALLKILGPRAAKLVSSGDPVADKRMRQKFVAAYDTFHELDSEGDNKKILVIGEEEWPMPIPLVRVEDDGWKFDTEAGAEEILNRRIGRNELNVIEICRAYVEAQRDYAALHRLPDGRTEYAQRFISTPGKHDGLYWPVKAGEEESPLGPLIANAEAEGYTAAKRQPYHGYYYRILKRQGPNAASGAMSYMAKGHMAGGFALIAMPAKYADSGIMTFIVNQNGIVFEKNLGPDTQKLAARITQYDPDAGWKTP
jgi:hypothetical protein